MTPEEQIVERAKAVSLRIQHLNSFAATPHIADAIGAAVNDARRWQWHDVSEPVAGAECGDRIVIVVEERPFAGAKFLQRRLVILEATETGWDSPDPRYAGYTPWDGLMWTWESTLLEW